MKKLLSILGVALLLTSCSNPVKPTNDPGHVTTLEIQRSVVDTFAISIVGENVYALDDNAEVMYTLQQHGPGKVVIDFFWFGLIIIWAILGIVVMGFRMVESL